MTSCTVLILTYKGKHHLEHLLPTVREAINNSPNYLIDVLIVDNGQDKLTKDYVNQNYPEYSFKFSPSNDYLFSLNPFILNLRSEFVLILNDDMKVDHEIFNTILPPIIDNNNVFSVMSKILNWEGTEELSGIRSLKYTRGWAKSDWVNYNGDSIQKTLYCGGGAGVFRVSYFNELSGFDNLFRPAYCEDLDLGHRAWHKGWESLFNPNSILFHREGATIKKQFQSDKLTQQIYRNQILWMVRNCDKPFFIFQFCLLLPYRLAFKWWVSKNSYIALWKSIPQLPRAILKRITNKKNILTDKQISELLNF